MKDSIRISEVKIVETTNNNIYIQIIIINIFFLNINQFVTVCKVYNITMPVKEAIALLFCIGVYTFVCLNKKKTYTI